MMVSLGLPQTRELSNLEGVDNYRHVRFYISLDWRVASCAEGRQWILQRRKTANDWRGRKYLSRREGIARVAIQLFGRLDYERVRDQIEALPI
jgi:hypothetical protein